MKINAIGVTTFGNKLQFAKTATVVMTGAASGLAADTFVKGLSKPEQEVEEFIKANDSNLGEDDCIDACCDDCCDESCN